jgi:antirestriction protein ArdC
MNKVYQFVTERIVNAVKAGGILPWLKPWKTGSAKIKSYDGKEYRGINVLLVLLSGKTGPWLTFEKARSLGGSVRKGEKATMITFYKLIEAKDQPNPDRKKFIPIMRYFNVFSLCQCENVPSPAWLEKEKGQTVTVDPIAQAESVWDNYSDKPSISFGASGACYIPSQDAIEMPARDSFRSAPDFYSVLFHEATHSTGHSKRLDRNKGKAYFGSEAYSQEELVAEIGASMLMAAAGVETDQTARNSEAYVANWLKRLNGDPSLIVTAASLAQKAVDHITKSTDDSEQTDCQTSS